LNPKCMQIYIFWILHKNDKTPHCVCVCICKAMFGNFFFFRETAKTGLSVWLSNTSLGQKLIYQDVKPNMALNVWPDFYSTELSDQVDLKNKKKLINIKQILG